jgi:glycosyltransferase involved in cell wall biosynthesis
VLSRGETYFVFDTQPDFTGSYWKTRREIRKLETRLKPDLVYSILAPSYFKFEVTEVIRFANSWVTNPNEHARATLSAIERVKSYLYRVNQGRLLGKRKYFITQTRVVKEALLSMTGARSEDVAVIPNVLPDVYNRLPAAPGRRDSTFFNVLSVGAAYKHKNFEIIPRVISLLRERYGVDRVVFHLTLDEGSGTWREIAGAVARMGASGSARNHGRLSQEELAVLYGESQLFFLPTLLETFSASLLEAMHFRVPVVTTGFPFNTEVTGDAALYFRPGDAADAASKIYQVIVNQDNVVEMLKDNATRRSRLYSDYGKYFGDTLDFLQHVYLKECKSNRFGDERSLTAGGAGSPGNTRSVNKRKRGGGI